MWYKLILIADWFGEMAERYKLVRDFNRSAKNTYISGEADTLLEARITRGDSTYKHAFSKFMGGGLRIKAMAGRPMEQSELIEIGKTILDQEELVRKLISLGWDTLEIHSNMGHLGVKWPLKKFAHMGGYLKG